MPNVNTLSVIMLNVANNPFMLSVVEVNVVVLNISILNVVLLNVIKLSVVMLNVIMLSVVTPKHSNCNINFLFIKCSRQNVSNILILRVLSSFLEFYRVYWGFKRFYQLYCVLSRLLNVMKFVQFIEFCLKITNLLRIVDIYVVLLPLIKKTKNFLLSFTNSGKYG